MATFVELTESEVTFSIECLSEDTPIDGNAMASGDDAADQECYDWIRAELYRGNDWAWCCVKVTATWEGFKGVDYLGCCSYHSEADFRQDGYYDDMRGRALEDLNASVRHAAETVAPRLSPNPWFDDQGRLDPDGRLLGKPQS